MTERILHALRAVPPILLPLVPVPFVAASALFLWSLVNLIAHGAGGSIS